MLSCLKAVQNEMVGELTWFFQQLLCLSIRQMEGKTGKMCFWGAVSHPSEAQAVISLQTDPPAPGTGYLRKYAEF